MVDKNLLDFPTTTEALSSDWVHVNQGGIDKKISLADFIAELNGGNPFNVTVKEESSTSRTLTISDKNAYIRCLNDAQTTITVENAATHGWKIGDSVVLRKEGDGNVLLVAGSGVTIQASSSGLTLTELGQAGQLICVDATPSATVFDFLTGGNAVLDLATHEAAVDPHPQYMTSAEVDTRLSQPITSITTTTLSTSGSSTLNGGAVFNELGDDVDFRIESDTNANAFFLDGASGNVGINTALPQLKLHVIDAPAASPAYADNSQVAMIVEDATRPGIQLVGSAGNSGTIRFGDNTSAQAGQIAYDHLNDTMLLNTAGVERVRIESNGNVLFSTTLNNANLATATTPTSGMAYGAGQYLAIARDGATSLVLNRTSNDGTVASFSRNGTTVGSISVTTTATAYNTSSDYRLKENVVPMDNAADRVLALKPCRFNFIANPDQVVDGFLAHEAQEVVPEAVHGVKDGMRTEEYEVSPAVYEDVVIPAEYDEEGNEVSPERTEQKLVSEAVIGTREVPDYQGIDQSKLVPLLTKALQEALQRIEALEAQVNLL